MEKKISDNSEKGNLDDSVLVQEDALVDHIICQPMQHHHHHCSWDLRSRWAVIKTCFPKLVGFQFKGVNFCHVHCGPIHSELIENFKAFNYLTIAAAGSSAS